MTKTLPSSVHHRTPTLSVLDNRGQAIRSIAYQREQSAGPLDKRISRTTYTALGTVETQTDARFFTEHPSAASAVNNFRYGSSLSGKVVHTASVDAGEVETLFDIESRPCWSSDSQTTTTQYEYDTLGRPTTVTEQHEHHVAVTERLIYANNATASSSQNLAVSDGHNALGQLIYHLDPAGVVKTDSFSLAGKPLAQTRQLLANDDIQVNWPAFKNFEELQEVLPTPYYRTQWQQNATGEMVAQWDAKGNRQRLSYTVSGQLNSSYLTPFKQASEQAIVSRIHYSAAGQVLEETAGNGTVTTYTYETKTQRLIQLKSTRPSKTGRPTVLQDLRYCYDPVGNIITIDDAAQQTQYFANQEVSAQRQYTYDTLYQLITATGREDAKAGVQTQALPPLKTPLPQAADGQLAAYKRFYQYDRGGSLIQIKHIGAEQYTRTIEIAERSNRAAFILNEPNGHSVEKEAQSFDGQGNLLALSTGQTLHWNPRNQLSQAIMIERAEGSPDDEEHYLYGSDRMRVSKTTTTQGASGLQRDNVIYLPGLELRKQNNGKEELDVILMGEAGRCHVRVLHWEKGKPESIENDQLRYSIDDQIGSSLIELDAQADKLSEEVYYPYGGTALWATKSKIEAQYKYVRYSGKERDATGLYYYGYRYYMPWIGRWLNPDPAGTVDGLNLFRMVRGNPIAFSDNYGNTSATLFIWLPDYKVSWNESRVGHVSLLIDSEMAPSESTYVSWWPATEAFSSFFGLLRSRDLEPNPNTFNDDWETEGERDFDSEEHLNQSIYPSGLSTQLLETFSEDVSWKKIQGILEKGPDFAAEVFGEKYRGHARIYQLPKATQDILKKKPVPDIFAYLTSSPIKKILKQYRSVKNKILASDLIWVEQNRHKVWRINLGGLDEENMMKKWEEIRTEENAKYSILGKNCAAIAAKVLKAGGADRISKMPSHRVWTPSRMFSYAKSFQKASENRMAENGKTY